MPVLTLTHMSLLIPFLTDLPPPFSHNLFKERGRPESTLIFVQGTFYPYAQRPSWRRLTLLATTVTPGDDRSARGGDAAA